MCKLSPYLILSILLTQALLSDEGSSEGSGKDTKPLSTSPLIIKAIIEDQVPHNPDAFTQGFHIHQAYWIEGTGLKGESKIKVLKAESEVVLREKSLEDTFFGEGVTLFNNVIHQLTWKSGKAFLWDFKNLDLLKTMDLPTREGWGLTHNGHALILSDGGSSIYFLSPTTYSVLKKVDVLSNSRPVRGLNELEYVNGHLLANVWPTPFIAIIHPESGRVKAWLDCRHIAARHPQGPRTDVLNGIGFDPATQKLYITGKKWPTTYRIKTPSLLLSPLNKLSTTTP